MTSLIGRLKTARTEILSLAGFASLTASAWTTFGLGAGLAATGISCLIVEFLSSPEASR